MLSKAFMYSREAALQVHWDLQRFAGKLFYGVYSSSKQGEEKLTVLKVSNEGLKV